MKSISRAFLISTLAAVAAAFFAVETTSAQETIALRSGQQVSGDVVRVHFDRGGLRLYNRSRVRVEVRGVGAVEGNDLDLIGSWRAEELADSTIQRFGLVSGGGGGGRPHGGQPAGGGAGPAGPVERVLFPKMQQPAAQPNTPAATPWQPLPPMSTTTPPPAIVVPEIPRFNGVSDSGSNAFVAKLNLTKLGAEYLFEGQITNTSPKKWHDVRAIVHTADMAVTEYSDVATALDSAKGAVTFRIPLATGFDPQKTDVFLQIKCYTESGADENRRANYYTFKIERLSTGQYAAKAQ